jgi:hypothetical protein
MKVKPKFLMYGPFHLNNGKERKDKWLGKYSFKQ